MHIEIFERAKSYFEELGHNVVAGYISPSHDAYVTSKMNHSGYSSISGIHRLEMLRLSLSGSNWIEATSWELNQQGFVDFPSVYRYFKLYFQNKLDVPFTLYYLCGSDHAYKCGLYRSSQIKTIAVGRPGYSNLKNVSKCEDFHYLEDETNDFSSTIMRDALINGDSIEEYTYPSVIDYMRENNITITKL